MKRLSIILTILAMLLIFCACEKTEDTVESKSNTEQSWDTVCNHAFGDWIQTKEPSCTALGEQRRECVYCSFEEINEVNMISHLVVPIPEIKPSCVSLGKTEGSQCSLCGLVINEQKDLLPTGEHILEEWTEKTPATCTSKGVETRGCKECDFEDTRSIDEKPHTVVIDEYEAPDCITSGKTQGSHCSVCETVIEEQEDIPPSGNHLEYMFKEYIKEPSIGQSGSAVFACVSCGETKTQELSALEKITLSKGDIYNVEANEDNIAIDNVWYVFDGHKETVGIYDPGNEWFGNVGDVLTITLGQEILLTDLVLYAAGNWTIASVTVKNSSGEVVLFKPEVISNNFAFGGEGERLEVFKGENVKAYTIEIKILSNKDNPRGFKVTEVEIIGAKTDTRLPHNHQYRELVKEISQSTCTVNGLEEYKCFCGKIEEREKPLLDHKFDTLISSSRVECERDGEDVYQCYCGKTNKVITPHRGHIYERLKEYVVVPTNSKGGEAIYQCVTCDKTEQRQIEPLPLENINYLRVEKIENGVVTIKFNIYGEKVNYEIRYSENIIDEGNFESATLVNANVMGEREISCAFDLEATLTKCYYVAVRPYCGESYGEISTIRVGGNHIIPIDYSSGMVYHGEVIDSFAPMFDEQGEEYFNPSNLPRTTLNQIFKDSWDTTLYGMNLSPIIDLEYTHFVSFAYLYSNASGVDIKVRWSREAVDFMAEDSLWDGVCSFKSSSGWNDVAIYANVRYVQIIFKDSQAPAEIMLRGYQSGEGDKISTEKRPLPTLNEMMGMCGFVAAGDGNTPVKSVSCTNILREYHQLEWSCTVRDFPGKSSFFSGWMGNFDSKYSEYSLAGINVIPCIQWDVKNFSVSYKVDENGNPIKNGEDFIVGDYWDKFNPHTYFQYSDAMFSYSARYGRNNSNELLEIAKVHMKSERVGLGYIQWIELGNEPDGWWNGVHSYLSPYQLAAFTSAGYDGHERAMHSSVSNTGYHFGVKNADSTMKVAMAGIDGIKSQFISSMLYWMKANRSDEKIALDAFNVHHYMNKEITLSNGTRVLVGISPEEGDLVGKMLSLIEIRDKYYSDKEVWLSEFGWDTNQSYGTENSAHAYADYTGRQVQAMWLTRAYLLLSSIGVDKAMMYMCEDTEIENEAVGKFKTSGVIGYEYHEKGYTVEVKKDSYFYLYTLKNTLGDYSFQRQIKAYDDNVMIFEYKNSQGKIAYAAWCPTSDGTTYDGYKLKIEGENATLVETKYGYVDGVSSSLEKDELGYVTINVSENPIYILAD